ncbi:TPA: 23S rRNA (uracil(1939)-C(5))-methyltransferase RlmD [Legionella pneumophila]|uniref:23S rRNA (uracil(1939)-C(5))-methyltransferase RlmD n=1 Tax=Legionella pneumophila TaxID=446 RepID=UPI00048134A9|nr:23S rRNA (uracil(1939)-C(5))-methyltransferase RlmD [Legionella pneumophila]ANH12822.1 23S rRNA (uracil(1939)-C(5))-methyltransferase [Legionella pneumophila]ANH15789.1 23S rRNA (uracil(1939)-C(5))-methyltransferase [Legionella pneumophila]ANH18755.1 23S rRNA (uracil(1939)-C(5))-methyltransferase [Legionella pneumophila]AOU43095.1 23S rRNA (uracil(1939)-C(5))-methyltransferase [Legionella pneumophila]APX19642.1 23S rRNA (uracil(1939)-C(5))-methyltransferase [Legionella pneumophila]
MRKVKPKLNLTSQTARIVNLSHDGRGIARVNGKATFIQGALPGEVVEFQYTRVKKDFDEGKLLSIVEPSTLRVEPKCPHYQMCGGCSLQHMSAEEQIRFKQSHLLDLLSRYGHTEPQSVLSPLTSHHWNYRNKARLSTRFVEKKQSTMVGFRERNNPRFITEINQCPILNSKIDTDIVHLRKLIDTMEDKQCIAQIEVAAGDNEVALIFRNLSPLTEQDELKIREFAQQFQYKVFLQPGGLDSVFCFYPSDAHAYLSYELPDYQITFQFHPNDFTQVNAELNRKMVTQAIQLMELKNSDIVLDLFCGLGNFSLPMAKHCSRVIGVEGNKNMVERAYMNAKSNHITNVDFYAANLDDVMEVRNLVNTSFSKVLIDPPRSGALEIVKQIDSIDPERIVYVSCNPITLARDTDILVNQKGYVLITAGVMDMFPHTAHVESIALFQKG